MDLNKIEGWRKSTFSNPDNCVEHLAHGGMHHVRDTKDAGNGPVLSFTADEWAAFRQGVAAGEFS